jgi:hypothetical protein
MPSRFRAVSASVLSAPVWVFGPPCVLAGCSLRDLSRPPLPAELTPAAVSARMLPPVTLADLEHGDDVQPGVEKRGHQPPGEIEVEKDGQQDADDPQGEHLPRPRPTTRSSPF